MQVDLNSAKCIVEQSGLLSSKFINICNGTEVEVTHGAVTLTLGALGILLMLLIAWAFAVLIYDTIR